MSTLTGQGHIVTYRHADTACRLQCYGRDSLATIWRTDFPSRLDGSVEETGIKLFTLGNRIIHLASRIDDDSIFAVKRAFDATSGTLLQDTVLFGVEIPRELTKNYRVLRTDVSRGHTYAIAYILSRYINAHALEYDVLLMREDMTPVLRRSIRFDHASDEELLQINVDDEGSIYVVSQTFEDRNKIQVTKTRLLGEAKQQHLETIFTETSGLRARLSECAAIVEDPNTMRIMAAAYSGPPAGGLAAVAVAKMDFRNDTVSNRHFIKISAEDIYKGIRSENLDYPVLVGCLVRDNSPAYLMVFEQRSAPISDPNEVYCDNVMMVALEKNGDLKWCSGFHKVQIDRTGRLNMGSFASEVVSDGVARFTYSQGSSLFARDFTLFNGRPVGDDAPRTIADITKNRSGANYFMRRTIHWLDEHTVILAVAVDEGRELDIKLCRIDLEEATRGGQ